MLSSIKTEKQIEEMKQLGAEDYLIKPSSYEEYVRVARDIKNKVLE